MQFGIREKRCLHGPFRNFRFHKNQCSEDITDLLAPRKFGRIFDIFLPTCGKFGTGMRTDFYLANVGFAKKDAVTDILCL